jgi:ATP-dependent Clp protease ATP-binding subunit ClpA
MAFDTFLRALLERARAEAERDRSSTIEAQHLLLAMAAPSELETAELLGSLGLDHGTLRGALELELGHALHAAGLSVSAAVLPEGKGSSRPAPAVGFSVQHALERGLGTLRAAPRPAHLLLGILQAEVGTVPRALALAGIDRSTLLGRVRRTLEAESP